MTPEDRLTTPEARALYTRVQTRLRAQGTWRAEYALGLAPTAEWCAEYLRGARALRTLNLSTEALRLHENILKHSLKLAREALRLWFAALPPAEMNAQGEDAMIATLCAPLPQLVAPLVLESA